MFTSVAVFVSVSSLEFPLNSKLLIVHHLGTHTSDLACVHQYIAVCDKFI